MTNQSIQIAKWKKIEQYLVGIELVYLILGYLLMRRVGFHSEHIGTIMAYFILGDMMLGSVIFAIKKQRQQRLLNQQSRGRRAIPYILVIGINLIAFVLVIHQVYSNSYLIYLIFRGIVYIVSQEGSLAGILEEEEIR